MWEWHFEAHLIWNWVDLAKMVKVVLFNDSTRKGPQSPTPITYGRIYANFVGKHSEPEAKWQCSAGLLFAFSPQEAKSIAETGSNCQLYFWKPADPELSVWCCLVNSFWQGLWFSISYGTWNWDGLPQLNSTTELSTVFIGDPVLKSEVLSLFGDGGGGQNTVLHSV